MLPEELGNLTCMIRIQIDQNSISGPVPSSLANLISAQHFHMNNNSLNGTIPPDLGRSPKLLHLVSDNPIRKPTPPQLYSVCACNDITTLSAFDPPADQNQLCQAQTCPPTYELVPQLDLQEKCICASPISVDYRLKSPGFTFFEPYRQEIYKYMSGGLNLTLVQVSVTNYSWEPGPRLRMLLKLFSVNQDGTNQNFNLTEMGNLYETFAGWHIPDNNDFGPYEVISFTLPPGVDLYPSSGKSSSSLSGGAIAGIILGCSAASAAIVAAVMWFRKHRRLVFRHRNLQVDKG